MYRSVPVIVAVVVVGLSGLSRAEDQIDFASQIQPIFVEHCAKCHGEEKQLGELRIDTLEAIHGNEDDNLLVAGKPEESELFARITLPADDKKRMPKGADPLPQEAIDLIRTWIAQGGGMEIPEESSDGEPKQELPVVTNATVQAVCGGITTGMAIWIYM